MIGDKRKKDVPPSTETPLNTSPVKKKNTFKQSKSQDNNGSGRTRNFATVVYPTKEYFDIVECDYDGAEGYGSPPDNWKEIIADLHVPVMISPLHKDDKDPDGKIKKPHWHVLFMFDTVKNWKTQVKPIFDSFGGVGREEVNSARGYARYLCHLDNPNRAQYNPSDVVCYGGADYKAVISLPTDDILILKDVFEYIRINQIHSLAELLDVCAVNNPDWFSTIAMSRAYIVDKYIKSLTWEEESGYIRKSMINTETGEIMDNDEKEKSKENE